MPAKSGDTVLVHYTGTLQDGTVFDSSLDGEPLEATIGEGMLIPGFENALVGMAPGDAKTVTIEPSDAYGEHIEDLVLTVPRESVPPHITPELGVMVQLSMESGEDFEAMITDVTDAAVTLDANHPLAGETLVFELQLKEIR
jgi:FKBP-type peptidyl-prolyl cis-trans isomerases 2